LATNGVGRFERSTNADGVAWTDLPLMIPQVRTITANGENFVFASLIPQGATNQPAPAGLLEQVLGGTNLVYYDWELTGPRIEAWLYMAQLFRLVLHQAQVPPPRPACFCSEPSRPGSGIVSPRWLTPARSTLIVRKSSAGFTAIELHLLADWLESPNFPRGLNTFVGPPDPLPRPKPKSAAWGRAPTLPCRLPRCRFPAPPTRPRHLISEVRGQRGNFLPQISGLLG